MYTLTNDFLDLKQIAESGQCFRWEELSENTYKINMLNKSVTVTQEKNQFTFLCEEEEFETLWRNYLDLDYDYEKIIQQIEDKDEFLKAAALYGKGIRILNQDLWEMIISFVISQNNNIPRITKTLKALCDRFGEFPDCDALCEAGVENLQGLGLGYRDEYIIEAAKYYKKQGESEGFANKFKYMSYEESMKELMTVKGIGKKVANCICLFGLHKLEACPIDTWIKKIIEEDYSSVMPDWMKSENAGIYQQYVFYYKRNYER